MSRLDFRFGAPVLSSDDRLIGALERLVTGREGFDPHSIVVKENDQFSGRRLAPGSWYLHDEVLVPVRRVATATEDEVLLDLSAAECRRLKPYLSHHYRPVDSGAALRMVVAVASTGITPPNLDEVAAKSADELEIAKGENVMLGHIGRRLGHVQEVIFDAGELVGVVMKPNGFFHQDLLVPVRFLARSDDLALFVDATEDDVRRLQPIQP